MIAISAEVLPRPTQVRTSFSIGQMAPRCGRGAPVGTPEAVLEENAQHLEIDGLPQAIVGAQPASGELALAIGVCRHKSQRNPGKLRSSLPELMEELETSRHREVAKHEVGLICQDLCEADLPARDGGKRAFT